MRLAIDRAFAVKGFGAVVTGTIVSGRVAEGDELVTLPEGRPVRVRGVQVHGRPAREATAPGRVAVNLGGIETAQLSRGVTLASPGSLAVTRRADVELELLPGAKPLRHGGRVRVHHGTSEVLGRVSICATRRAGTDEWTAARPGETSVAVPAGGRALVRLRLERPAVLTRHDRLVLRAYSPPVTIGGGTVLDPEPAAAGVRRAGALGRFSQLAQPAQAIAVFVRDAGARGVDAATLVRRAGLDTAAARAALDREVSEGRAHEAGSRVFDRAVASAIETGILTTLSEFHGAHPLENGMPREALRERVAARASPELFDSVLADLTARAAVRAADRVSRADHRPALSAEEGRLREQVCDILRAAGLKPPDLPALAGMTHAPAAAVQAIVQRLVREKRLVKLDTLLLHPEVLSGLKKEIRDGAAAGRETVDVATFKERYGLTRKFAIPLLEWLDRERVTRRVGEKRVVTGYG
jgi:selenocysteine-specific elongation factor